MNCPINCPPRALRVPSCGQYRVLLEINTSPPWEHTHSPSVFLALSNNLYRIYFLPLLWKFTRKEFTCDFSFHSTFQMFPPFASGWLATSETLLRIHALSDFRWFFLTVSRIVSRYFLRTDIFISFFFLYVFKLEIMFVWKSCDWKEIRNEIYAIVNWRLW